MPAPAPPLLNCRHKQLLPPKFAGSGGGWRGYNVAPAKGLCLCTVHYPPEVDDPAALLYPHLLHDEWGRLLGRIPGESSDEG
jgi:hypothetical protein